MEIDAVARLAASARDSWGECDDYSYFSANQIGGECR